MPLRGLKYATPGTSYVSDWLLNEKDNADFEETIDWYKAHALEMTSWAEALLACNDRFFLLTGLLNRKDAENPWLFDRCREVERDPDGHIDLWSRFHYKSTLITFAGAIQEILADPEIKIAIFSVTRPIAHAFLSQIKEEFENNEHLKECFHKVLYQTPRTMSESGERPSKWSIERGITVKRTSNPKEATLEAHGLIDGQPTSRHYDLHIYDDVVTQDHLTEEAIRKTTERWELADNLGSHLGVRKWMVGTRYHHADTYGVVIERKSLKPRIYPATDDGLLTGNPVFLTPERWAEIKRDQRSTVSAQCLLNPTAGTECTFDPLWLQVYDVIPAVMNVYIMVDPSKGRGERSDRTAIAVVGIDQGGSKYLLDGVRHRMKLSERWNWIKTFHREWSKHSGVQLVRVGYERYGMLSDIEVINDMMQTEGNWIVITELGTPLSGGHSKKDRIERLEPDIRQARFRLPCAVYHPDYGGDCYWGVWTEAMEEGAKKLEQKPDYRVGQVFYRKMLGPTKMQRSVREPRIIKAIRRRDENGEIYDVTRCFVEELCLHPFAPHDDLIDAASRIYDLEPHAPVAFEGKSTQPVGLDMDEMHEGADMDTVTDYGDSPGSMGTPF